MSLIILFLILAMLAVLWCDVTRYLIPNSLVLALLLLYPAAVWMAPAPVDWKMALAAMGLVFVIGYIVFTMKWMGGGDIKLLTVCALWVGIAHLLDFIFIVTALGGVFAAGVWLTRKALPFIPQVQNRPMPRLLQEGAPVPYGVAIACGFLLMLWWGYIPAVRH